jgi:hypothetical protein
VIADSGSRRRLQGLTRRCRCQALHANPPCQHQLSSHPLVRSAPSFRPDPHAPRAGAHSGGQGWPVFGPPRQRRAASLTAASTTAGSIASGASRRTHRTWGKESAHEQLKKLLMLTCRIFPVVCAGSRRLGRGDARCGRGGRGRHRRLSDHRTSQNPTILDRTITHVTITDPQHCLFGKRLAVIRERSGRGPTYVVVELPDGRKRPIRIASTDLAATVITSGAASDLPRISVPNAGQRRQQRRPPGLRLLLILVPARPQRHDRAS